MAISDPTVVGVAAAVIPMIPVVVGGLLAIGGGLAVAIANHFFTARRERAVAKRAKLDNLVSAAHDLAIWLKKNDNYYLWGRDEVLEKSPMATILTVSGLYWPELTPEARVLDTAVDGYIQWLIDGAQLRLAATPPIVPPGHMATLLTVWTPLLLARKGLVTRAEGLVKNL